MIENYEKLYRAFVPTKNKHPTMKYKDVPDADLLSYEDVKDLPEFSGILKENIVLIDIDDKEQTEIMMQIVEDLQLNCKVHQSRKGGHFLFVNDGLIDSNKTKCRLACGLTVDIKVGCRNGIETLKIDGQERFCEWDIEEGQEYQVIPKWLTPVSSKYDFLNMAEGGRNSALFGYELVLQANRFKKDEVRETIRIINKYIIKEPLSEEEMEIILRDEAFKKYEVEPLNSISASDLLSMELPPVYFAVNDFLPMGLSIIASPPKFGKSYLCTQLSIAVANGSDFLGFKTNKSGVLYMALEDSFNRCKERLIQELQGKTPPSNLDIMIDCPSLANGLIDQLQEYVNEHLDTKLIIIDTFAKVRDGSKSNEGAYSSDYREAGAIKKFADKNQIAVLLVHHTRKMKDISDPFANISGTQGLTGACDTMIVLTKEKRIDDLTQLSITGRDVYQNEYAISRDKETGIWMKREESMEQLAMKINVQVLRMEYTNSNLRKTLMKLLENKKEWSGRCSDIITASKGYGFPITETPQKLSKKFAEYNPFLLEDKIFHSEIENGSGSKKHKFEKSS